MTRPDALWHVPVRAQEVPESGSRFSLDADAPTRAAVAALVGVRELTALHAEFEVTPSRGGGLRVTGAVSALVQQTCVVTLEAMSTEIDEPVDLTFSRPAGCAGRIADGGEPTEDVDELVNGGVDLGALAVEFLVLSIDPYPRKPGVIFTPPAPEAADEHPFAALADLKRKRDGKG